MDNKYTVVAYKPDSSDTCRGCLMASYPSDCRLFVGVNRHQLIEHWAQIKAHVLDQGEVEYCVTVLSSFNGAPVVVFSDQGIDHSEHWDYNQLVNPEQTEYPKLAEQFNQLVEIQAEAVVLAKQIVDQRNAKLAEQRSQEIAKQKQDTEDREKKQLAALLAKYRQHEPNPTI